MPPALFRKDRIMSDAPDIVRVRHEIRRRTLRVERVETLAPRMVRIVFTGAELQGFTSLGFDDHVKLFFHGMQAGDTAMRDFTPRKYDAVSGELWIDFHVHTAGPAAQWAAQAAVGQTLEIAGPKGSSIIPIAGIDTHVLIGDESALPAIGRRLEELPRSSSALVVAEVEPGAELHSLGGDSQTDVHWVHRGAAALQPAQHLIDTLRTLPFPVDRSFVWIATETRAARALRRHFVEELHFDKHWVKAAGYWQQGKSGAHEPIVDAA
jgi:NADPH-dependent ferric siderophore reductase